MWGTIPRAIMEPALTNFSITNPEFKFNYSEKKVDTYKLDLTEALANGAGPDLIMVDNENIYPFFSRIIAIPFESFSDATYRQSFVTESDIFLRRNGILAFPLVVDPIVMYYNKSLLDSAGISNPMTKWSDVVLSSPKLTKKDNAFNISQGAIALGTFSNIRHAKDILSLLFIQNGVPVFAPGGNFVATVFSKSNIAGAAENTLKFFLDFSNPALEHSSWSRSMPDSREAFLSEKLALYLGYASELQGIRTSNPNLNFDVAKVPQQEGAYIETTFGHIYAVALAKSSKNPTVAIQAILALTNTANEMALAQSLNLPPARRDLLGAVPASPFYLKTFYQSALISRAFVDPNPSSTESIFQNLVENILSGGVNINQAVSEADRVLRESIK